MKTYIGVSQCADGSGGQMVSVIDDAGTHALNPRFDLRRHSPTGFQWGYAGSGPAQLALALCADALGDDERAQSVYQRFKFAVVAGWKMGEPWTITSAEAVKVIARLELEREERRGAS